MKVMRQMLLFTFIKREREMDESVPILVSDDFSLHIDCLEQMKSHPWEDIEIIPILWATSNNATIPGLRQSVERQMKDEKVEDEAK